MIDDLFDSYLRTTYSAETPLGAIHLRIGQPCELLIHLLQQHNLTCWAYVTAFNPESRQLSAAENHRRQCQLEESLCDPDLIFYRGAGVGDDPQWPPETSVLILGITRAEAIKLAREFGQNAIVAGEADAVPELVDCRLT